MPLERANLVDAAKSLYLLILDEEVTVSIEKVQQVVQAESLRGPA